MNKVRVLFIGSRTFNYENIIAKEIESRECEVVFYDERLRGNFYDKFALRYLPGLISKRKKQYYDQILERHRLDHFDYLFVLRGEIVPIDFLRSFRAQHPGCRLKLMMWDSVENYPQMAEKISAFDDVFSFDLKDCRKYKLHFRPLFFNQAAQDDDYSSIQPHIDLSFVGTIHSDRLKILRELSKQGSFSNNFVMFLQGKLIFYIRKLTDRSYFGYTVDDFRFQFLSASEVMEVFVNSKAVIDIHHPGQTGLTMRTLEVLSAGRKLVTTNSEVVEYDFYHPNNILVIDRNKPLITREFLMKPFIPVERAIIERYSLKSFVSEIFYELSTQGS